MLAASPPKQRLHPDSYREQVVLPPAYLCALLHAQLGKGGVKHGGVAPVLALGLNRVVLCMF